MILIKEVDSSFFELYDKVSINVDVHSEYRLKNRGFFNREICAGAQPRSLHKECMDRLKGMDHGLGLTFEESPVSPYTKDLSVYERAADYEKEFDIANWRFYMAFDEDKPVGAMTVAGRTEGLHMLSGRNDACVLWDIRVADAYKHNGIGQKLLDMGAERARNDGYRQMIIECQNNNVTACKFYQKQGAVLSKIDCYAYYSQPDIRDEIQFVWYLDL